MITVTFDQCKLSDNWDQETVIHVKEDATVSEIAEVFDQIMRSLAYTDEQVKKVLG